VPATAVLAERFAGEWAGAPATGAGGAVGAWLSVLLAEQLGEGGQWAALIGGAAAGGLLALEVVVVRLGRGRRRVGRRRRPRPPVSEPRPRPAGGLVVLDDIPIHHHDACDPQPVGVVDLGRDEPCLSNGLRSEKDRFADFVLPPMTLLEDAKPVVHTEQDQALRERATQLEKSFADFGVNVRVVGIHTGPVVTLYEVTLETGLRVHKVTSLVDDI